MAELDIKNQKQADQTVFSGKEPGTDTPQWLQQAGEAAKNAAPNKIADLGDLAAPVLRVEKPTAAEIGEDPSSSIAVLETANFDLVKKAEAQAAEKMRRAGLNPINAAPVEPLTEEASAPDEAIIVDKQNLQPEPVEPDEVEVQESVKKAEAVKSAEKKRSVLESVKALFDFSSKKPATKPLEKDVATEPIAAQIESEVENVVQGSELKPDVKKAPDAKLSKEEKQKYIEAEKIFQEGVVAIKDLIAPASMDIQYDMLRMDGMYAQSFYVFSYPRYLNVNWLAPVINFDVTMDISQFIYPINSGDIMKQLKKKVAQMESSIRMQSEKGQVRDPGLETALEDAELLRTQIQRGQEKFFQFALYFTVYADSHKKLAKVVKQIESLLAGKLVMTKKTQIQAEHGLNSTLPLCLDELYTIRNMNTGPLSTTFPFTSSDLTSDKGILYGVNRHNDSLIIFDRFALENANSVVFAKSGAGKSYAVKLEILRLMMMGTDVLVIDPENEYEALATTVGGSYLRLSLNSDRRINPFDLPKPVDGEDVQPGDLLRSSVINLHGLMKLMLGDLSPEEESMMDKALLDVYALKGITMDVVDPSSYQPPTMEDLYQILSSMEGAQSLVQRLSKYTVGSYAGIFNKATNVDLSSGMMVFCIRDLEDALRPVAMYIILNHIWNKVRSELKKRILVIDEAWTMMQHEDSAKFLFGLVKRARKYYLGVTTITQDVEDFIKSDYGKPIITNSSLQLLLKQSPSAVDLLAQIFNLTEGERYVLLNSGVGQGLFFAGLKHVAVQVIASYTEDKIVTTDPEELLAARNA